MQPHHASVLGTPAECKSASCNCTACKGDMCYSHLHKEISYLAICRKGVLLCVGTVQDLLALAVQDNHICEAGLLDLQLGEQQAESLGCIRHQPLQGDTPCHLQHDNATKACEKQLFIIAVIVHAQRLQRALTAMSRC